MKLYHNLKSKLLGRNTASTPPDVIIDQMNEPRPLPMGRKAFEEWSDRIISGALVPGAPDPESARLLRRSQIFGMASMIMHLGPTEDHKPDAYFIHSLRKSAANQIAHSVLMDIKKEQEAEKAAEQKAALDKMLSSAEVTDGESAQDVVDAPTKT